MISYAQNFEDVILERIFKDKTSGFYVDIGACHPVHDSVTCHFYLKGWRGVNVEPQPKLFDELNTLRGRDTNLPMCAGAAAGHATLFVTREVGTSTLSRSIAENYRKDLNILEELTVEVVTLDQIWSEHVRDRQVDFLKIDVEGFEKEVLTGADFSRVAPSVLVIEATIPNSPELCHGQWEALILQYYEFFYFDGLNRFYARKEYPLDKAAFSVPANVFDRFRCFPQVLAEQARDSLATENQALKMQLQMSLAQLGRKDAALDDAAKAYQVLGEKFDEKILELTDLHGRLSGKIQPEGIPKAPARSPGVQRTRPKSSGGVCIFTIVSNNYLHYANTLFESLQEHCPEADLVLGLCDRMMPETCCNEAEIIEINKLDIPELGTFIYQYSILELNTAIKPYLVELLMNRGYKKIMYFDPDIRVYHNLDLMLALLDEHNVLLTPHLTGLLDDGKWPTELGILQAGSYNLGFIALRACEETRKLVKWWQAKLYKECVVDLPRNLFVDQKWMDLVPAMFAGVYINRDPSWNVAYWNLNHRRLEQRADGCFDVDGKPLTFFHFSGFSIEATTLSKHQNRFDKGPRGTPLRRLCSLYEDALTRNGLQRFKNIPWAFSNFADGTKVPDAARRLIRTSDALAGVDFFDKEQCVQVHAELNRLVHSKKGGISLTALALSLWESRADLRDAFPAVESVDSIRFAEWFLDVAPIETDFSELYLAPVRQQLERARAKNAWQPQTISDFVVSKICRIAWQQRRRVPLKIRIALAPYAGWALRRAYPRPELLHAPQRSSEIGINLIGYLHAESGVGEAARASLRALRHSGLPFSLVDYRLGNISRMGETVRGNGDHLRYPINLVHVNADQIKIAREYLGDELFRDRYTIGFWYWEMPVFPDFLHFSYDLVDEVWVSTEYNRAAVSRFTHKPVMIIPPAIELHIEKRLTRTDLHLDPDAFIFLHMSDTLSLPERKNPLGVIKAFQLAFGDKPEINVRLIIKLSNLDRQPTLADEVYAAKESDPRIRLVDDYLDRNTLNNLVNACDCYVSLHRAEGFGLPLAEAMYLGKPAIATNWSGNVDFMNEENSLPVQYTLIELDRDIGPYQKGQIWAEPDINDAAQKMLLILNDAELCVRLGQAAGATIRKGFGPSNIGKLIAARAAEIYAIAS